MNKLRDHYPILLHPMKIKSKLPLTVTCYLHLDMHDIDWLLLIPTELHKLKLYGFGIESIFSIFKFYLCSFHVTSTSCCQNKIMLLNPSLPISNYIYFSSILMIIRKYYKYHTKNISGTSFLHVYNTTETIFQLLFSLILPVIIICIKKNLSNNLRKERHYYNNQPYLRLD